MGRAKCHCQEFSSRLLTRIIVGRKGEISILLTVRDLAESREETFTQVRYDHCGMQSPHFLARKPPLLRLVVIYPKSSTR